ncbi:MAG: heme-binding protein [Rhodoferax sp.]
MKNNRGFVLWFEKVNMRAFFLFLFGLSFGSFAMAIEEPKFEVVIKDVTPEGTFELRQYAPYIVAETWVDGDMDAASSKGFRVIADYIFGNNQLAGSASGEKAAAKIAMTAPVTVEPLTAQSEKIAMTAPVTIEPSMGMSGTGKWRVHFVMPSEYTLASLPTPNNSAVHLREVPTTTLAVVTYSGFNTQHRIQQETENLTRWMQIKKLKAKGGALLARYDPPWTLPIWRRNEVQFEVSKP